MNIAEILKKAGLEIGEDVAVATVKGVIKALPDILLATENKMDDMLIPLLALIEKPILDLLDKIDGAKE